MSVGMLPQFFPREYTRAADVQGTAVQIFAASAGRKRFTHVVIQNTIAAAHTVTFRAVADTPVILIVPVAASSTLVLPGWDVNTAGLEVLSSAAVAGLHLTFFHTVGKV